MYVQTYVIFKEFYRFSFLYPVAVFLVAVCSAADFFFFYFICWSFPKSPIGNFSFIMSAVTFKFRKISFKRAMYFHHQSGVILCLNVKYEPDS